MVGARGQIISDGAAKPMFCKSAWRWPAEGHEDYRACGLSICEARKDTGPGFGAVDGVTGKHHDRPFTDRHLGSIFNIA
jgi:hypothetical protein